MTHPRDGNQPIQGWVRIQRKVGQFCVTINSLLNFLFGDLQGFFILCFQNGFHPAAEQQKSYDTADGF